MTDAQRANLEALVRRNAEACENARRPTCVCGCKGALHGKKHSAAWISAQAELLGASLALRAMCKAADFENPMAKQTELFT